MRAETLDGFQFTPRYNNGRPTIWKPTEWDGRVPRGQVRTALDEVFDRFKVSRLYADPPRWETDVDEWASAFGDDVVMEWPTYRAVPMHQALERFLTDLQAGRITHDGCPDTDRAMANARRLAKMSDRYVLGKPSQTQKIDPTMASVLAHEAAADARADGWGIETDSRMFVFA